MSIHPFKLLKAKHISKCVINLGGRRRGRKIRRRKRRGSKMQRSSSTTRVADDFYKNLLSSSSPITGDGHGNGIGNGSGNSTLPVYTHAAKKDKSRLRSAENAVHLIPLVLLLCAVILWFSSNPVDVVNKKPSHVEGLKAVGGTDIDGTQNNLMAQVELEDVDLLDHHRPHRHLSIRKPFI